MTRETTTGWEEELPHLNIELMANGCLLLTCPDWQGNGDSVLTVHPVQLRFMAEKLGLVREVSASDAEIIRTLRGQLADSVRTVNTLVRRMRVIKARVDHLGEWLCTKSDSEHADLSYEMDYANATCDINDEFCADLDEIAARAGNAGTVTEVTPVALQLPVDHVTPPAAMSRQETPAPEASGKACANPSGKASAKASVKASEPGTSSLFGGVDP